MKLKMLSDIQAEAVEDAVCLMLHASRDCMRNRGLDTTKVPFDATDGYYGEAFGIMRGLQALGYGEFGPDNIPNSVHGPWNLKWWFSQLAGAVLVEEHFGPEYAENRFANQCEHCFDRYGRDAVRDRNRPSVINVDKIT